MSFRPVLLMAIEDRFTYGVYNIVKAVLMLALPLHMNQRTVCCNSGIEIIIYVKKLRHEIYFVRSTRKYREHSIIFR